MILIKNIHVYDPRDIGIKDVLIGGEKIVQIATAIEWKNVETIDGTGKILVPGLIDNHVHVTGGGGEAGFSSKAPEVKFSKLIEGGITTVCGLLGTDGATRSVENLVSKLNALKEQGMSAFGFTGSYRFPSNTLTGDVEKDILFIDPIIGVKIALSDHRNSNISEQELARLATEARIAGMISKKAGVVIVHMGDGKRGLKPIRNIVHETDIPASVFRPTHCNRNPHLLEESYEWLKVDGYVDFTCGISKEYRPAEVIADSKKKNLPQEKITVSSDGNGSFSEYDEEGNITKIGVSSVSALYEEFLALVDRGFSVEQALPYFTTNIAKGYKLKEKMGLKENMDADMLILDEKLALDTVIARGTCFLKNGELQTEKYLEF